MKRTLQLVLALLVCLPALARAQTAPFVYDGGTLPNGKSDFAVQPSVPANQKIVASEWNAVMADVYDVRTAIWPGGLGFGFKTLQAPLTSPDGGSSLFVLDGGAGLQPTLNWESPNGTITQLGGSPWSCAIPLDVAGDASFQCGSATIIAGAFCGPISNTCTGATTGDGCSCQAAAGFTDNLYVTCTCYVSSTGNITYLLHNTDTASRTVHSSYKLRTFH